MYRLLANKITNTFIKNQIIKEEEKEVYIYGLEVLLALILTTVFIIIFSIPIKLFFETLLYLLGFFTVRTICGGYHAKHHFSCFCLTMGSYLMFLLINYFVAKMNVVYPISIVFSLLAALVILLFAPVEHPNNPMTAYRKNKNRKLSILLAVLILCVVGFGFFFNNLYQKVLQINLGIFLAAMAILVAKIELIISKRKEVQA